LVDGFGCATHDVEDGRIGAHGGPVGSPHSAGDRGMSWSIIIMYAVAAVLALVGAGLLLALTRPSGPAKVYVFRMCGIMLLAGGIVLAMSATAMWNWSTEDASLTATSESVTL
jgi:hypothetical protein